MTTALARGRLVRVFRGAASVAAALAVFVAVGWWLAPEAVTRRAAGGPADGLDSRPGVVWTCSMHPQIRLAAPGQCPLCGMNLVPAAAGGETSGVTLTPEGRRVARVEVAEARRGAAVLTIATVGRFALDETLVHRISAYLTGRVDAVHVPLEGNRIEAGAPLVDFSSAELASLHAELKSAGALGEAVKTAVTERLRRAGLTDAQIGELEKQPNPVQRITLLTPVGGVVTERAVRPGMFVKDGDLFAAVASFDRLVLDVDVFEKDLARVAPGVQARVTVDALPGDSFEGTVASVKPFLDAETRTAQARILVDNRGGRAMPGMYARVELRIPLGADGRPLSSAATAPAGSLYACPMRCVPAGPEPGKCPKCGMALKRLDDAEAAAERQPLLVPVTAVLGFGRRQLVYVETRELHYEPREVTTGPRIGSDVMILTGLRAGEKVVARGAFLVDSQTQIEGRESLIRTEARPGEGSRPAGHGGHR